MRDNFDYQKTIILNIQLTKILEYEFEVDISIFLIIIYAEEQMKIRLLLQ